MITRRHLMATTGAFLGASALPAFAADRRGTFEGRSRHVTTGDAVLTETEIQLADDFTLDRRVDPIVGLGKDGVWDPATYAGDLINLEGAQSYALPEGINAADYNEVYIWCRAADVPLGVAALQ